MSNSGNAVPEPPKPAAGGAGPDAAAAAAGAADAAKKSAGRPQNPVFKMMGLPHLRMRLPSRNWLIFWTVVGSWTSAWAYDRREKRKIQEKWGKMVAHLADERMDIFELPRKVTVFLTTPPADSVITAREHFHEYVKPVLAKGGLDWEAVEGRREGDVRAGLAEQIRRRRKEAGENTEEPIDVENDNEARIQAVRDRFGVKRSTQIGGDIVIGRNTWKEYMRGLHEGWLGPIDTPKAAQETDAVLEPVVDLKEEKAEAQAKLAQSRPHDLGSVPAYAAEQIMHVKTSSTSPPTDGSSPAESASPEPTSADAAGDQKPDTLEEKKEGEAEAEKDPKKKTKKQPPPFITPSEYSSASPAASTPDVLGPSVVIPLPHILGFRHTPLRMYRFLRQRYVADEVGRAVAAAVLASYDRPYQQETVAAASQNTDDAAPSTYDRSTSSERVAWEQEALLLKEEREWHKSLRKDRDPSKESVWLDPMVIDPRIGEKMRMFQVSAEDEARAQRIRAGTEGVLGEGDNKWDD